MSDQSRKPKLDFNEEQLDQRIRASLSVAVTYTQRHQKLNSFLTILVIVTSALTAFLTAVTAVEGPVVVPGLLDWQGACSMGAILSTITTIASGISQQMNIGKKLIEGSQCVGRLRALDLAAATNSRDAKEITGEYVEILAAFPEATR